MNFIAILQIKIGKTKVNESYNARKLSKHKTAYSFTILTIQLKYELSIPSKSPFFLESRSFYGDVLKYLNNYRCFSIS